MSEIVDLVGQKFGRLTVEKFDKIDHQAYWLCRCECGKLVSKRGSSLRNGNTKSCGCYRREFSSQIGKTHGMTNTKAYHCWSGMISRCYNKKSTSYKNYGGRGIRVCHAWRHSFEAFLADMGMPTIPKPTVERKNVNGNYSPDNCVWATKKQQQRNRRNKKRYSHDGKSLSLGEWSEIVGISSWNLFQRINRYGWSIERALSTPVMPPFGLVRH